MEVWFHKDRFIPPVSSASFFFFPVTLSHDSLSPVIPGGKGGFEPNEPANEETRNIPHWPRETGNLPAPASGSVIKAVFEMSQKCRCGLTSCTCDRLATSTLLVSDARKHSLCLGKRVHSHTQIILALLLTI